MQKQTFKLSKLATSLFVIALGTSSANMPSFAVGGFVGGKFIHPKIKYVEKDDKNRSSSKEDNAEEFETELTDLLRAAQIGISAEMVFMINEMFGLGARIDAGVSFVKYKMKNAKDFDGINLSEGFFFRILGMFAFTQYANLFIGFEGKYTTLDFTLPDENKKKRDETTQLATEGYKFASKFKDFNSIPELSDEDQKALSSVFGAEDQDAFLAKAYKAMGDRMSRSGQTATVPAGDIQKVDPFAYISNVSGSSWIWSVVAGLRANIPLTDSLFLTLEVMFNIPISDLEAKVTSKYSKGLITEWNYELKWNTSQNDIDQDENVVRTREALQRAEQAAAAAAGSGSGAVDDGLVQGVEAAQRAVDQAENNAARNARMEPDLGISAKSNLLPEGEVQRTFNLKATPGAVFNVGIRFVVA